MLLKFFRTRNRNVPNPDPGFAGVVAGEKPLILQIIHAGGMVERYYMAFPAAWIMDKYPNFVLARPEIFRRPWDSVVHPEEILVPGHRYFVVPIPTVKKLHRRIRKPNIEISNCLVCPVGKPETDNARVRVPEDEGKKKKSSNGIRLRKTKNPRFSPSLTIIYETRGFDD